MQYIIRNKSFIGNCLGALLILTTVWFFGINTPAYSVLVDGHEEFVVSNPVLVTQALEELQNQEQGASVIKMAIKNRVGYEKIFVKRSELLPSIQIGEELRFALQPKVMAAAIELNGKPVVYVQNKAIAEAMLNQLKINNSQLIPGEKLVSVDFEGKVQIEEVKASTARVMAWKDAWNLITVGTSAPQKYIVQPGDSLWLIARKNNMYVSDIVQANHVQEDSILSLGQEIVLNKSQPLLNVIAKVEGKGNVVIPYQTQTITDSSVSGAQVRTEGQNGEKYVAYIATKRNGELEKRDVSEEKILQEAVDRVVVRNNRTYQVASRGGGGSGNLDWPIYGSITQGYGGGHTGIDIAGSRGTTIGAADSGTVTFAGREGGYGNFVIINHGNGVVTRYAHCDSILVKEGQQVSQGQAIATRGSTGRSTGPHLHFEVLQNGTFRNPLNYLH